MLISSWEGRRNSLLAQPVTHRPIFIRRGVLAARNFGVFYFTLTLGVIVVSVFIGRQLEIIQGNIWVASPWLVGSSDWHITVLRLPVGSGQVHPFSEHSYPCQQPIGRHTYPQ